MRTIRKTLLFGTIAVGVLIIMFACDAPTLRADGLPLTITIGAITVTPGETDVIVTGDIDNTSGVDVDDNGAAENVPYAVLPIDDSAFYDAENVPYPLPAGQDTGPIDLFTVNISALAVPGDYVDDGTFDVLDSSGNIVGEGTFTVDIVSSSVTTPEPSTFFLLIGGVFAIAGIQLSSKRRLAPRN